MLGHGDCCGALLGGGGLRVYHGVYVKIIMRAVKAVINDRFVRAHRVALLYNKTTKLCKKFPLCKNLHKKYAAFFKAAHKKRSLDLCCHAFESQNTI